MARFSCESPKSRLSINCICLKGCERKSPTKKGPRFRTSEYLPSLIRCWVFLPALNTNYLTSENHRFSESRLRCITRHRVTISGLGEVLVNKMTSMQPLHIPKSRYTMVRRVWDERWNNGGDDGRHFGDPDV